MIKFTLWCGNKKGPGAQRVVWVRHWQCISPEHQQCITGVTLWELSSPLSLVFVSTVILATTLLFYVTSAAEYGFFIASWLMHTGLLLVTFSQPLTYFQNSRAHAIIYVINLPKTIHFKESISVIVASVLKFCMLDTIKEPFTNTPAWG